MERVFPKGGEMPHETNVAIARALVDLFSALAELEETAQPAVGNLVGRRHVLRAIKELIVLSPAYDGDMPNCLASPDALQMSNITKLPRRRQG